jgi:DNA repair protein RadD
MPLTLRPYQTEALHAVLEALRAGQDPCLSLPTASGKSAVIAALCDALAGRVLCLTHRKELLAQNEAEALTYADDLDTGIVSAGLERRDYHARVVFGGIASIYRSMGRLLQHGAFRTIILDECHYGVGTRSHTPPTMYGRVFAACPDARRVGLSATPYTLDQGPLYGHPDAWFSHLAYEVGIRDLTPQYLAPLKGVLTAHAVDTSQVRTRQGEYVTSDLSQAACDEGLVEGTLTELCTLAAKRRKWVVFCVDIPHAALVCARLQAKGIDARLVTHLTPREERDATVEAFRRGDFRALVNVAVFTTGFNVRDIDCIALLRPTQSKSLVVQCLGRGCRQHESKKDCLVLDFAGALERFAPLDALDSLYRSPARAEADAEKERKAAARRARQLTHDQDASLLDPMGEGATQLARRVRHITYSVSDSKKHRGKQLFVVRYKLDGEVPWATAWLCHEYPGQARTYAAPWFERRGVDVPATAAAALTASATYPRPTRVVLRRDGTFWRIAIEQFDTNEGGTDVSTPDDDHHHPHPAAP